MAETPDDPHWVHGDGGFKRKLHPFRRKTDALLERMDADRKVAFFPRDAASFTYAWYRTVKAAHVWRVFPVLGVDLLPPASRARFPCSYPCRRYLAVSSLLFSPQCVFRSSRPAAHQVGPQRARLVNGLNPMPRPGQPHLQSPIGRRPRRTIWSPVYGRRRGRGRAFHIVGEAPRGGALTVLD